MAKTIKEERLRWILPIVNKEIKLVEAAKVCPYSKRSKDKIMEYQIQQHHALRIRRQESE